MGTLAPAKEIVIKPEIGTIFFEQRKINDQGQFTLEWERRTIGPNEDISSESDQIQFACQSARAEYVAPEPEVEE